MKHSSYRRIIDLDRMIRTGRLESAEKAARHFRVTRRTIERDLDELRNDLNATIKYNRSKRKYEYEGNPVTLPAQWMNEREIALILIAERALRVFTGTSFEKEIHPAFNNLLAPIRHDRKMMGKIRELCKSVIFFNPYEPVKDVQKEFSIILEAIMSNKRVSMEYRAIKGKKIPRRHMDPYRLLSNGNQWFVVGLCKKSEAITAFSLNMIYKPKIEDMCFLMPDDINAQEYIDKVKK